MKRPESDGAGHLSSQSIATTGPGLAQCCWQTADPSALSSQRTILILQGEDDGQSLAQLNVHNIIMDSCHSPFRSVSVVLRMVLCVKLTGMRSKRLNVRIKSSFVPETGRPSGAYWLISRAS